MSISRSPLHLRSGKKANRNDSTWRDESTGAEIDYYEIELKSFQQQIYPNLAATDLQGYDGMSQDQC